jgi:hypothetical protein
MQCEQKQTKTITYECMGTTIFAIVWHKQKSLYVHESCISIAIHCFMHHLNIEIRPSIAKNKHLLLEF